MFDYAYRYDIYIPICLYFDSFHGILTIVLLSLLTGLIWEVFTLVDKDLSELE